MADVPRANHRQALWIASAFLAGIALAIFGPWALRNLVKTIFPYHPEEVARVTSPDGVVDAVMINSDCGVPCSNTYLVVIVPKGGKPPEAFERYEFSADNMVDGQMRWKQPHLLEIAYRIALINQFRNLSYPLAKPGDKGSWDYKVEVRLAPSSQDFSYLQK